MENQQKTKRFDKVIVISIGHFVHDIYSSFLAPVLPLLIEKLGISYTLASILNIIQRLPSLANPFVGMLADKTSLRYAVIAAPFVTGTVMSLLGMSPNFTVLAILLFIMGISSTFFHVPTPVMIKKSAGDRVGLGMSFYMLGGELARTLGPLFVLAGISLWGFDGTYRLIPLAFIVSLVLYFKLRDISIHQTAQQRIESGKISDEFRKYLPFFLSISGFLIFSSVMRASLSVFLPTYLTSQGESLWVGGINLAIYQFAGAAGTFAAGGISDRIGRRYTLLISSVATPIIMFLFVYFKDSVMSIPLLIVLGFFLLSSGSVLLALVQDKKTARPAFLNGMYMTTNFIIHAIGAFSTGYFGDWFGLEQVFLFSAFLAVGAIPFVFVITQKK